MTPEAVLAERFRSAGHRWATVHGTYREWRRQDLTDIGFYRYRARVSDAGIETVNSIAIARDGASPHDSVIEAVLTVAASDAGKHRRAEAVSRIGDEWLPDLVVFDGDTFWARTGDAIQTNGGDPDHGHGGADFIRLLTPHEVPDGYDLTALDETEIVAERPSDIVLAVAKAPDPNAYVPESEVFDMISGGDSFRLNVDKDTGILLRVTKLVDGHEAEVREFLEIAIDSPIPDGAFQPLC